MKIGEYDIDDTDELKINTILSDFLNFTCTVVGGTPNGAGRSVKEDKQYRLNIDNKRHASVKLRYDKQSYHQVELIVNEVRDKLGMTNYDVKRISGFPMNGEKWRKGDCLLIDWGIQNTRTDLATLNPEYLSQEEKDIFFEEIAVNAAFAYCLGLWDRENRNFVWDKTDKKIISIDHESLLIEDVDLSIPTGISNVLTKFFGENWYDDKTMRTNFTNSFSSMWYSIAKIKTEISEIFEKYDRSPNAFPISRIDKGPNIPLGLIMMPAIDR